MNRFRIALAFVVLVAGVGLIVANFGTAHPEFSAENASPMPDEVRSASPEEVRIVFPEGAEGGIDAVRSAMWVIRVQGDTVVAFGGVDLDTADRIEMFAPIEEPLEPGLYMVKWVGISINDDGFSEGDYRFAISSE